MSRTVAVQLIIASLVAVSALGCGSLDPAANAGKDAAAAPGGELLPWKVGNRWTYRVTDNGDISTKVTVIGDLELVAGTGPNADKMANQVVTTKKDATDKTISWQALIDGRVIRYREQAYSAGTGLLEEEEHWDPYKLHIDGTSEHRVKGTSWLEVYQETKLPVDGQPSSHEARDLWSVISDSEEVVVPAGTFQAVVIQKAGGSNAKTYWYVPGVGKVKETGGQVEELVTFELVP